MEDCLNSYQNLEYVCYLLLYEKFLFPEGFMDILQWILEGWCSKCYFLKQLSVTHIYEQKVAARD